MNKLFTFLALVFLCSCSSFQKYNAHIEKEIPVNKLKKDVDFVYKKLKRYHPKLDLYLSQDSIDYKFDSLKNAITKPLKPNEFYVNFFPIFESLKHGHTDIYPLYKRLDKKQIKKYKNSKSAFNDYSFFWRNDSVFLVNDLSKKNRINSGSALFYIDSVSTKYLYDKYKKSVYGDGYNTTFSDNVFNRTFLNFMTLEEGIKDSVELTFKMGNSIIRKKTFRTYPKTKSEKVAETPKITKEQKEVERKVRIKQKKYGYSKSSKTYSKDLTFPTNDSTIAVLKVTDFRKGKIRELYKEVFTDIKNHKVENLVLDLRNNGGGYIKDAHYLYAYLVDDSKSFLGKKIVANKTSFGKSLYNLFPVVSYPFLWLGSGYSYFSTTKNIDNEYELHMPFSFVKIDKDLVYKKNLYVIINGGSYSASSLISANLQAKKRAFFVGEETGGDYNGTVAGLMPKFTLPHSKLKMSVGTVYLSPIEKRDELGHGVYPDKEIKPTLVNKIKRFDVELNWILNDIKNGNKSLNKQFQLVE
ncbi:S41 family peptidase [Empedobacter brevis]|uniref:S41 family peptidase n=1 Tax=Empedobacter brevis TaxID=247 RepID=UPI0039B0845E